MPSKSERCDHGGKKGKRNNSGPKNQKEGLSLTKGFIYQMQYSSRGRRRNTRRNTALRATTTTGQIREDPRAETCAAHDTREGGS